MNLAQAMQLASQHGAQGRPTIAEFIYTQILEQQVGFADAAILLMRSLSGRGETDSLKFQLYRLESLFGDNEQVLSEIANCYLMMGAVESSTSLLLKKLESHPQSSLLKRSLANAYRLCGERQLAIHYFWEAWTLDQSDMYSLYALSELDKSEHREKILEALSSSDRTQIAPEDLPFYHFALAYLYENNDNKRFFQHLHKANSLVASDHDKLIQQLRDNYRGVVKRFSSHPAPSRPMCPDQAPAPIFIMAPPRSGTTLLEQILGAHSQTKAVGESFAVAQAIARFAQSSQLVSPYWQWPPEVYQQSLEKIEAYYYANPRIGGKGQLSIVDKSIENVLYAGLILSIWPNARIIRLVRHPLDTILSSYRHSFTSSSGKEYLYNLEALAHFYANYEKHMVFWQQAYPDQVTMLDYESLVSDPEYHTRELLAFCGLEWEQSCLDFHTRTGTILTASTEQVRQPVHKKSICRWKTFFDDLEPARRVLQEELGLAFDR